MANVKVIDHKRQEIVFGAQNILPYLYGRSMIVYHPEKRKYFDAEALRSIHHQIGHFPKNFKLFGVNLRTIKSPSELTAGIKLIRFTEEGGKIEKSIFEVTKVDYEKEEIFTRSLWPHANAGYEGRMSFKIIEEIFDGSKYHMYPSVFFYYTGDIPKKGAGKNGFKEDVQEMAADMKTLIECWTMAKDKSFRDDSYFSFDPFEGYFLKNFSKYHSGMCHNEVWDILHCVFFYNEFRGIRKIYQPGDSYPFHRSDLITPILEKMQADIFRELIHDEELVDIIFRPGHDDYMKTRLRILTKMYNATREVTIVSSSFRNEENSQKSFSEEVKHKINIIIKLIQKGQTAGEKSAARHAYKRLTGEEYAG